MIFLKPTVLRSDAATNSLTTDRYEYLRGEQHRLMPEERPFWHEPNGPFLPALPAPAGVGVAPPLPAAAAPQAQ
jgi:general secretion pathway protein D